MAQSQRLCAAGDFAQLGLCAAGLKVGDFAQLVEFAPYAHLNRHFVAGIPQPMEEICNS